MTVLESVQDALKFLDKTKTLWQDNKYFKPYFDYLSLAYLNNEDQITQEMQTQEDSLVGYSCDHVVTDNTIPTAYNCSQSLKAFNGRILFDTSFSESKGTIADNLDVDDVKHATMSISSTGIKLKYFDSQNQTVGKTAIEQNEQGQIVMTVNDKQVGQAISQLELEPIEPPPSQG